MGNAKFKVGQPVQILLGAGMVVESIREEGGAFFYCLKNFMDEVPENKLRARGENIGQAFGSWITGVMMENYNNRAKK